MSLLRPFYYWMSTIPPAYVVVGSSGSCNDWCFLCEFENHVQRTRLSSQAFSPMNILSRLPNIGGTLGYGRQEDAHEFMRFVFPHNIIISLIVMNCSLTVWNDFILYLVW